MYCYEVIEKLKNDFKAKSGFVYTDPNKTEITKKQFEIIEKEFKKLDTLNCMLTERNQYLEAKIDQLESKNQKSNTNTLNSFH